MRWNEEGLFLAVANPGDAFGFNLFAVELDLGIRPQGRAHSPSGLVGYQPSPAPKLSLLPVKIGQVVIPAALRRKYGIEANTQVAVIDDGDAIRIVPHREISMSDLDGIFASDIPTPTPEQIAAAVAAGYAEGWDDDATD